MYADTPDLLDVPADWLQKGKTGVRYSHHLYFWSALTKMSMLQITHWRKIQQAVTTPSTVIQSIGDKRLVQLKTLQR